MVRMGTVWDRTTEVLSGRGGAIARIAFLGIFLPTVVNSAYKVYLGGPAAAPSLLALGAVLAIAVLVLVVWANLAMIALSSDPAATPSSAMALALRRLGPALGVVLVILVLFVVLLIPPFAVLFGGATNFSPELIQAGVMPTVAPGAALFFALYMLALLVFAVFLSARLAVTNAAIVNERLGLGAMRRSFTLTRGSVWRIIGVMILYAIVVIVATLAAQSVVGIVFALILGRAPTVVFLASIAAAAVSAAAAAIAAAFIAQLYIAFTAPGEGPRLAQTFE